MATRPPTAVLAAFEAEPALLHPLSGGQGTAWSAGELVLKPLDMSLAALEWQDAVLNDIAEDGFRLARPVRTSSGDLVAGGWSGWQRLAGQHVRGRWADIGAVGERFHQACAHIPPPSWHEQRTDPFAMADRAAWQPEALAPFRSLSVVDRLAALLHPIQGRDQLIHGDLSGNVLFQSGLAPGIIDLSPYWRPPLFSTAVIVMDAVLWEGADDGLVGILHGDRDAAQYLVRAAIFRVVMDHLCNPDRHETPAWWPSLPDVTARLCSRAASRGRLPACQFQPCSSRGPSASASPR